MTAPDDVHSLTAAYVLDAVSSCEQDVFERHLADCPACLREIREMREAVVKMVGADAYPPAPEMRQRALAGAGKDGRAAAGRWQRHRVRAAVFAVAVAAVLLGLATGDLFTAPASQRGQPAVQAAPDAHTSSGVATVGGTVTAVVSRLHGRLMVSVDGLPALDNSHRYQVWMTGAGSPRSAGLLDGGTQTVLADIPVGVSRIAITIEPAGGSAGPTTPGIALISLS